MSQDNPSLDDALALHRQGRLTEAAGLYRALIARDPRDSDAHNLLGLTEAAAGRLDAALALIDQAIALAPADERYRLNGANVLRGQGRFDAALAYLDAAVAAKGDYAEAWAARGQILAHLGRREDALASFDRVAALRPDDGAARTSRGLLLSDLGRYDAALPELDQAVALRPDHADSHGARAQALAALGRDEDAAAALALVIRLRPDSAATYKEHGEILLRLHRAADALVAFDHAIALNPDQAETHNSRGLALLALGRHADALAAFDRAVALAPTLPAPRYNRGQVLCDLRRYPDAVAAFSEMIAAGMEAPFLLGHRFAAQLQCCDWTDYDVRANMIAVAVATDVAADTPFNFLMHATSPALQLAAARTFVALSAPARPALKPKPAARQGKIRLAYLSADFNNHATALLAGGLFAAHDRTAFDVTAVSFGLEDNIGARLRQSFDRFIDARTLSDADTARLMVDAGIDIAVDLKGHTAQSRPGIMAWRPAPVQAQFLGFPATMGADYIDYILADRHVIPPGDEAFYSEKVIRLPGSYQVNDGNRPLPSHPVDRAALGLPEHAFVFCCFNTSTKIAPPVFDVWMRLLRQVDGSVLWLLQDTPEAAANLRREAVARGVAAERLIFAPRAPFDIHLSRHAAADLFLDTLPCNAHTTASDALWAGLPVLTCMGQTFTGRVCGSLLAAFGMPELIAASLDAYETLAARIATTPTLLAELKRKVASQRASSALFNVDTFRHGIETAYRAMWDRHLQGLPPAAIDLTSG